MQNITSIMPISGILPTQNTTGSTSAPGQSNGDFAKFLSDALDSVNNSQLAAQQADTNLAAGNTSDVASVMVTTEKAELAIDAAVQIRNKVIEAYQQIMQMQV
ncbi:MAG: flagellar hook-basal body complex protein FliE [Peptococcaceae bacterium]|nr:flagellar hook-basal body complex protein FliE [Peptococcaceae bacterium]